MNTSMQEKPALFTTIALMTLVNGIFNIIFGIALALGTFGILLICFPIALLPLILGGFEIGYSMKLLANPPQPVKPSLAIAWWEIAAVLVGNVFSMVVGILALVFYNDSTVKDYFVRLNNPQTPPSPPATPSPVQSTPEPVTPPAPVEEVPVWLKSEPPAEPPAAPVEEEAPAKPKRPRKVAKK